MNYSKVELEQLKELSNKAIENRTGCLFVIMNISSSMNRRIMADSPSGNVVYKNGKSELVKFDAKDMFDYVVRKQLSKSEQHKEIQNGYS